MNRLQDLWLAVRLAVRGLLAPNRHRIPAAAIAAVRPRSAPPWTPAPRPDAAAPSMLPDTSPDIARAAIIAAVKIFYSDAEATAAAVIRRAGWLCA